MSHKTINKRLQLILISLDLRNICLGFWKSNLCKCAKTIFSKSDTIPSSVSPLLIKAYRHNSYYLTWKVYLPLCEVADKPFPIQRNNILIHCDLLSRLASFIYLFIHLFIYSFIRLFIYSFIHLFIYSFIHLFIYSFIHLFIYSFIYSFIHSFIHSIIHSFIYLFIHILQWMNTVNEII